jgi:hypothetical protein
MDLVRDETTHQREDSMSPKLTREDVARLVDELRDLVPLDDCWTCECLQGYLTQLELDACEDVSDLTGMRKVPRSKIHGCLGCARCPPAEDFAAYLRTRDTKNL